MKTYCQRHKVIFSLTLVAFFAMGFLTLPSELLSARGLLGLVTFESESSRDRLTSDESERLTGRLIVQYEGPAMNHRGEEILQQYEQWADFLAAELKIDFVDIGNGRTQAFSRSIVAEMVSKKRTEKEVIGEISRRRQAKLAARQNPARSEGRKISLTKEYNLSHRFMVEVDGANLNDLLIEAEQNPNLRDFRFFAEKAVGVDSNDPAFGLQWGLHNVGQVIANIQGTPDADIDAPEAWDMTEGSRDIVIAVLDSGLQFGISDLYPSMWMNQEEFKTADGKFPSGLDSDADGFIEATEVLGYLEDLDGDGLVSFLDLFQSDLVNGIDEDHNGYTDDFMGRDAIENATWPDCGQYCCDYNGGEDCFDQDNIPLDIAGHGTRTFSVIGMVKDDNFGGAGVAPGCKIMPVRTHFETVGGGAIGTEFDIAEGLIYAIASGADVINMSLGSADAPPYHPEIQMAYDAGIILVSSAGNDNADEPHYPGAFAEVIAVGGVNSHFQKHTSSNFGSWVDISAPGWNILNWRGNDGFLVMSSGTSFAAPMVAGVAGLIKSQDPDLSPQEVLDLMQETASDFAPGETHALGAGVVNAYRALFDPCVGDLDDQPGVGFNDLTILLSAWGTCAPETCAADLNQDGAVDGTDLSILLENWGEC